MSAEFVIVATACSDCNEQAVALFYNQPTTEDLKRVEEEIGGMWCIKTRIFKREWSDDAGHEVFSLVEGLQ